MENAVSVSEKTGAKAQTSNEKEMNKYMCPAGWLRFKKHVNLSLERAI